MKKIFKAVAGSIAAACGVGMIAVGIYYTVNTSWEWLALVAFGVGVLIAGYSLARGAKAKDFVEMLRDTFSF